MQKYKEKNNISKGNVIQDLLKQNVSTKEITEITEVSKNDVEHIRDFQFFRLPAYQYYLIIKR